MMVSTDGRFMFKRIPFLTRREFARILERAERLSTGCLVLRGPDSHRVRLRNGTTHATLRVVWVETFGDKNTDNHEVVHRPGCPNTHTDHLCIEPTHLCLGDPVTRIAYRTERQQGAKTCPQSGA